MTFLAESLIERERFSLSGVQMPMLAAAPPVRSKAMSIGMFELAGFFVFIIALVGGLYVNRLH